MKYKHIVWDWNGTIIDDAWLCVEILNQSLRQRGMQVISLPEYGERFGFPVKAFYEQIGFDFSTETYEEVGREFIERYEKRRLECDLHRDVHQALKAFREAGATQSILSAYRQETLETLVDHFALTDYFTDLVGAPDYYACGKAEVGRRWLEKSGHDPNAMLMIGDTHHDYDVAQALGIDCILTPGGHSSLEKLEASGNPCVDSLPELLLRLGIPVETYAR